MRGYPRAALVVGILMLIFGIVFALQGKGTIGGSAMSNNSFWIYAGMVIAIVGVAISVLGAWTGSKSPKPKTGTP